MVTPPTIGRLRIERQLGAGGFATVWLAHDPELDSPVAVKILAENLAAQADIRRRFADEARLLRRVDSDHLVRVYDVGELPDGRPFFVMTYADRGNLAERMAHLPPPWPPPSVAAVVDALADALDVLHRHGVIHRDIKPRNVLLRGTPDGGERVLLGDLGIAKDLQWASGITVPTGSSGYAAPEQGGFSERIGPPTDVHALAMTAAELLGIRPPWPPTPLGAALARATEADPAHRTPTAPAFAAQFRAAVLGRPVAPGGTPATPPMTPPPMRHPPAAPPPPPRFPPPFPPASSGSLPPSGSLPLPGAVPPPGSMPPPGAMPPGAMPPGAMPPGSVPPGAMPPGAMPPGAMPPGAMPPGSVPPGSMPPGSVPTLVTSSSPSPGPGGVRPGGGRGILHGRPWLLPVAVGATVLVSGAAIWGGWAVTHQDRQVSPLDGRVSVKVPLSWHDRVDVPFPGGTDPRDGVRIESGRQAVSIAYSEDVRQPQDLLSQVRPARCASRSTSTVRVGRWNGLSDRLTSCEGGVDISEVALTSAGGEGSASSPGWTVWVEVRSFGGDPDLSAVLASLEIDPA